MLLGPAEVRRSLPLALGLALIVLVPRAARADAIEGPPACPPGARGLSSHAGTWCEVAACTSDSDCGAEGGHCRSWRVCTRRASIPPAGRGAYRDPPPPPREAELVVGSCDPARTCRGDEEPPPPSVGTFVEATPTCRVATYCVPDPLPALPLVAPPPGATPPAPSFEIAHASSCRCAAPGASRAAAPQWSLLALLSLAIRRRR